MIVWVASYPRSGNTFLRILLHELYGQDTYSGFDASDDINMDFPDRNPTGHKSWPDEIRRTIYKGGEDEIRRVLDQLEASEEIFFIKTHNTVDELFGSKCRAILLVRDGRDVLVSLGWYLMNVQRTLSRFFRVRLRLSQLWRPSYVFRTTILFTQTLLIALSKWSGMQARTWRWIVGYVAQTSRWSRLTLGWLDRSEGRTALVRFEDLIAEPVATVERALAELALELPAKAGRTPAFEDLKKLHPQFFRAGQVGGWEKELPADVVEVFLEANKAGLERFGYLDEG
jgi:hypothetical protein